MIWDILTTALICILGCICIFSQLKAIRLEKEIRGVRDDLRAERASSKELRSILQERDLQESYSRGLYAGKETNALWRKFLNQFDSKGQVSAILYGNPESGKK